MDAKINKIKLLLPVTLTLCIITGCAQKQDFKPIEQICIPQIENTDAIEQIKDVLAKMHFTIDKADPAHGIVRTKPLRAAQDFEFWRSDNVGQFNKSEANMHSLRRTAELKLSQQNQQLCINCSVNTQRLSLPQRQEAIGFRVDQMFSVRADYELILDSEQQEAASWIDLGNDQKLQTKILKRLEKRFARLQKENAK